ncbi:MAG: MurR/RpiR family transcriptional regulator [Firmicutes bacterium]|nr:MurR/RpiR family transcriptional regulator [Bacillota bacterium]
MTPVGGVMALLQTARFARTPALGRVAEYVRTHPREALTRSTYEIAAEAQVSPSVVIRFVRELGLRGMQDFRVTLAAELGAQLPTIYDEALAKGPSQGVAATVLRSIAQALVDTADALSEAALGECADRVRAARRIELYGVGASGFVAMDGAHKLGRLDLPAWAYTDPHLQIMFASNLTPADVAIAISHSGQTSDTVEAAQTARMAGAQVIAITSGREGPLARAAHQVLWTPAFDPPVMLGTFTSRIVHLAVIDALTVAIVAREPERLERMRSRAALLRRRKEDGR